MTYKCTNCDAYKRSKYEAGCYGSCGKRDCKECCESCGQHTLISMEVASLTNTLGLREDNPIAEMLQKMKNEVDRGDKTEAHWVVDKMTTPGYFGPPTIITYTKNGGITRSRFYSS